MEKVYKQTNVTGLVFDNLSLDGFLFDRSNVRKCSFKNCDMTGAVLDKCNFIECDFEGTDKSKATVNCCNFIEKEERDFERRHLNSAEAEETTTAKAAKKAKK